MLRFLLRSNLALDNQRTSVLHFPDSSSIDDCESKGKGISDSLSLGDVRMS